MTFSFWRLTCLTLQEKRDSINSKMTGGYRELRSTIKKSNGGTYAELQTVFVKLKEGASIDRFQELHDIPFGTYGQFYEKYGVHWIFVGEHALPGKP